MKLMQNWKIKHKLQVTGVLYLVLVLMVVYFYGNSRTLINRSSQQSEAMSELFKEIRQTEMAVQSYVFQRTTVEDLKTIITQLEGRLTGDNLTDNLKGVRQGIDAYHRLRSRNLVIEKDINELTESSLTASNDVIKILSDRLIGADTRQGVSDMERAVIVGANMNTNANFRIKLLFGRLKEDIQVKDELVKFLDTLVANVTKDIELLKGTTNEAAARQALTNNLSIKKMVLEYIDNVNELNTLEKEMNEQLVALDHDVDTSIQASSDSLFSTIKGYFTTIIAVVLGASIIGILVNFLLGKTISGSLHKLNLLVKDLAEGEGDLTKRITLKSQDETGELAKWINLFVEKLQTIIREVSTNADSLNSSSAELTAISHQMDEGARQASEQSNTVATAAEEMNSNMSSVAAASEEASTNVTMVAGASEEMAITVREIAKNSEKARIITGDAVAKASGATEKITRLGESAHEISKVTEVITEISEQTNLLALNATIEAARAGEAGKGFAVVANEIKELANQTAQATQEIKGRIEGIQDSSTQTMEEINIICQVINEINAIVAVIATAVEEQSATTQEIAGNVAQASEGIREVNENVSQTSAVSGQIAKAIGDVNRTAIGLADNSAQVNTSAEALAHLSGMLHQMVARFKL